MFSIGNVVAFHPKKNTTPARISRRLRFFDSFLTDNRPACKYFASGACRYGAECRFAHIIGALVFTKSQYFFFLSRKRITPSRVRFKVGDSPRSHRLENEPPTALTLITSLIKKLDPPAPRPPLGVSLSDLPPPPEGRLKRKPVPFILWF